MRKLIISSGDTGDVDGFFALAEYSKTGADVLFVMNYPRYVGETAYDPEYHVKNLGLGFQYSSEQVFEALVEPRPQRYLEFLERYKDLASNDKMKSAMTDIAFAITQKVWVDLSPENRGRLFFCIGGVNAINPFSAASVKNEVAVYIDALDNNPERISPEEGAVYAKDGSRLKDGLDLASYDEIFMDFNGSMAFFSDAWRQRLSDPAVASKIRGMFVMGGVLTDDAPRTMPSIPNVLNRFSSATINQLYHPQRSAAIFRMLAEKEKLVFTVTNNAVHDFETYADSERKVKTMDGVTKFLESNGLSGKFLRKLAIIHYQSKYNPPRKAFDFYTATALVWFMKHGALPLAPQRRMFYCSTYGLTLVSEGDTWAWARNSYVSRINTKLDPQDSEFERIKKENFPREISFMQELPELPNLMVRDIKFSMDKDSKKLSLEQPRKKDVDKAPTVLDPCVVPPADPGSHQVRAHDEEEQSRGKDSDKSSTLTARTALLVMFIACSSISAWLFTFNVVVAVAVMLFPITCGAYMFLAREDPLARELQAALDYAEAAELMRPLRELGVRHLKELRHVTVADIEGLGLKPVMRNRILALHSAQKKDSASAASMELRRADAEEKDSAFAASIELHRADAEERQLSTTEEIERLRAERSQPGVAETPLTSVVDNSRVARQPLHRSHTANEVLFTKVKEEEEYDVANSECDLNQKVLSLKEQEILKKTAKEWVAVDEDVSRFSDSWPPNCSSDPLSPRPGRSRFFEEPYDLQMGHPSEAVHGLEVRMCVDLAKYFGRISRGVEGIEEEFKDFYLECPSEREVVMDLFEYVCKMKPCDTVFPNGKLGEPIPLSHFAMHQNTHEAKLTEAELAALRLYTTSVFRYINKPLRDDERCRQKQACPLPVTTFFAKEGCKKLRALHLKDKGVGKPDVVLWRGMRSMKATEEFMSDGGTELAFMSTTKNLSVALRYSLSAESLIFKIMVPTFLSLGADLGWLSAFPTEAEILYPPLTYLKPTSRIEKVKSEHDGKPIYLTVVEIAAPTLQ